MTYLDLALWVSAIVLWICVVWKIVGSVIEWFDGIKKIKNDIESLKNTVKNNDNYCTTNVKSYSYVIRDLKERVENLEKKKR